MANAYTAVPNVLPGNVTVGGDLDVKGEVRVGPFTERVRVAAVSNNQGMFSFNLQKDIATRDNASKVAQGFHLGASSLLPRMDRFNAAGQSHSEAELLTMLTDYTLHTNTGNTTQNTIYSKTIRANLLGANGALRIKILGFCSTQGATPTVLSIRSGATVFFTFNIVAGDAGGGIFVDSTIFNTNSASAQLAFSTKTTASGTSNQPNIGGAINTANDAVLSVTLQSGAVGDVNSLQYISVELLNTFGPVT